MQHFFTKEAEILEVDVLLKVKLIHKSVRHFFSPDSLAVKTICYLIFGL